MGPLLPGVAGHESAEDRLARLGSEFRGHDHVLRPKAVLPGATNAVIYQPLDPPSATRRVSGDGRGHVESSGEKVVLSDQMVQEPDRQRLFGRNGPTGQEELLRL